ncbi:MAG: YeaH/YhbH family protein [Pseudomonadota bacterium]
MHIIDRRLNPKSKSLGNRQRFIRRAKNEIRNAVTKALRKRKISETEGGEKIRINSRSLREPSFGLGRKTGKKDFVIPGNQDYVVGDYIPKPEQGGGKGGGEGSPDGEGDDEFVFTLTREEFLDMFFEDLQLPNFIKKKLKDVNAQKPSRAGYTTDGPPAKLNRMRTMRNSLARRIALGRPKLHEIRELEKELKAEDAKDPPDMQRIKMIKEELAQLKRMSRIIAYIDPVDLQYNRFEHHPEPSTQAVMFCLMDTSASMSESLKDLAKRFYMLLFVFLSRHYTNLEIVFIRHTSKASEVDEDTFFRGRETGGTVISTAFEEMLKIVKQRYPVEDWNIYAAQASDGENYSHDMAKCIGLLNEKILPICQYFAYIEVGLEGHRVSRRDSIVWSGYRQLLKMHEHMAMKRVSSPDEIYPIFHDLFSSAEKT